MKKAVNYVKENKKIFIVVILLVALLGAVYAINKSKKSKEEPVNSTVSMSATEKKLCEILQSIKGVGQADVMINEGEGGILGVVIVCEGANNIMTRNDVLNVVSTALKIDKSIIAIYSMTV